MPQRLLHFELIRRGLSFYRRFVSVVIVSSAVLENVPSLRFMKPILPTHFWGDWTALFTGSSTSGMWLGVVSTLVFTTLFSVLAVARFQRKDILS